MGVKNTMICCELKQLHEIHFIFELSCMTLEDTFTFMITILDIIFFATLFNLNIIIYDPTHKYDEMCNYNFPTLQKEVPKTYGQTLFSNSNGCSCSCLILQKWIGQSIKTTKCDSKHLVLICDIPFTYHILAIFPYLKSEQYSKYYMVLQLILPKGEHISTYIMCNPLFKMRRI
jgi:hypothetical protein